MKTLHIIMLIICLFFQAGCQALKFKKVDAREVSPDPRKRVEKNLSEGRGFRLSDINKNNNTFSFASSNPLWQATLETLDFMPLTSANYSGGIIITDWYTEDQNINESIKITVKFLTNEIRSDALDIDIFKKICSTNSTNCSVAKGDNELVTKLNYSILNKAALIKKQDLKKNRDKNPYVFSEPSRENLNKKKKK